MSARHFHFSLIGNPAKKEATSAHDAMRIGRTTWIGLTAAVIGWAMLLGETGIADFMTIENPRMLPPTFHDDFVDVAKTLIYSGFGLAIVGALQTGFGALNRFFEAVLMRSGQKSQSQSLAVAPVAADSYKRETSFRRDDTYKRDEVVVAAPRMGRPYRTFADGSVEVETIVGNRRFRSMTEASDFI